jgi:uncharacterized cupin superfamily protein
MDRLNFLADEPWDEVDDDDLIRVRWFGHRFGTDQLGASLNEYLPRSPDSPMHMHYGVEEMFFVLSGTPTVRTPEGAEVLSPGDVVYFPEGPDGLHTFSNPTDEPVRMLGISTKRFPDVVAYPERGVAWVATRHPPSVRSPRAATRESSLASSWRLGTDMRHVSPLPRPAAARASP